MQRNRAAEEKGSRRANRRVRMGCAVGDAHLRAECPVFPRFCYSFQSRRETFGLFRCCFSMLSIEMPMPAFVLIRSGAFLRWRPGLPYRVGRREIEEFRNGSLPHFFRCAQASGGQRRPFPLGVAYFAINSQISIFGGWQGAPFVGPLRLRLRCIPFRRRGGAGMPFFSCLFLFARVCVSPCRLRAVLPLKSLGIGKGRKCLAWAGRCPFPAATKK